MIINTPISLGELIDKISILFIKKKNIQDLIHLTGLPSPKRERLLPFLKDILIFILGLKMVVY